MVKQKVIRRALRVLSAMVAGASGRLCEWMFIDAAKAEQERAMDKELAEAMRAIEQTEFAPQ